MKATAVTCIIVCIGLIIPQMHANNMPSSGTEIATFLQMWRQYQQNLYARHLISENDLQRFNLFYDLLQPYLKAKTGSTE